MIAFIVVLLVLFALGHGVGVLFFGVFHAGHLLLQAAVWGLVFYLAFRLVKKWTA